MPPDDLATAVLWCRQAAVPDPAHELDVRHRVARLEVDALLREYRSWRQAGVPSGLALEVGARMRTAELAAIDPDLAHLPFLACVAARAREDHKIACLRALLNELSARSTRGRERGHPVADARRS